MRSASNFELHVTGRGIELPWGCIEALIQEIKWKWADQENAFLYEPKRILALGKGAMIPARLLAKEKTPVYYVGVFSYKGQEQTAIDCHQDIHPLGCLTPLNDPETLIVDDLWDTGQTFQWAKERWPKARAAALLSKKPVHGLDYVGLVLPTESWIILPWEK